MAASPWDPDPFGPPRVRLTAVPAALPTRARLLVVGERAPGPPGTYPGPRSAADLLRGGAFTRGPSSERLARIGLGRPCGAANLLPWGPAGRWGEAERRAARSAAAELSELAGDYCLVAVCGRQAAAAFGLKWKPLKSTRGGRFLLLPHPSGRCRWWNLPGREIQAAAAVARALRAAGAAAECCGGWCP